MTDDEQQATPTTQFTTPELPVQQSDGDRVRALEAELVQARSEYDQLARMHQGLIVQHRELAQAGIEGEVFLAAILGQDTLEGWVSRPPLPCPPQLEPVVQNFLREYWRAKQKHGEMTMDGRMSGNAIQDNALRLAALMEEVGEVAHELTYDVRDDDGELAHAERLWKELVQVMNVAGTWAAWLWQQYGTVLGPQSASAASGSGQGGAALGGALAASEPPTQPGGVAPAVKGSVTPYVPTVGRRFVEAVEDVRGLPQCPKPDRGADVVGRDLEGRYWQLWHDEGLRCYLGTAAEVRTAVEAAALPRVVNLTRVDLAQYAEAER